MRFYVNFIENTKNGENRTQPKAYETLDEAMAYYHKTMGTDISSDAVLGCHALVFNSAGGIHINDLWGTFEKYVEPVVEPIEEPVDETTEDNTEEPVVEETTEE